MERNSAGGADGAAMTTPSSAASHLPAPERPADAGWLALRTPADDAARAEAVGPLLEPLIEHLGSAGGSMPVHVVDLGAGTGANAHWLAPRLPFAQHWTFVDHDVTLLERVRPSVPYRAVPGPIGELAELLPADAGPPALITCSALLDVLTEDDLSAACAVAAAAGSAVLFSLSVTGKIVLSPDDPFDETLVSTFNAHQRRGGQLGPSAPAAAQTQLQELGFTVRMAATDWQLDSTVPDLVAAWLEGCVEAVREQAPEEADAADRWLHARRRQLADGTLSARVPHLDLLALPPRG